MTPHSTRPTRSDNAGSHSQASTEPPAHRPPNLSAAYLSIKHTCNPHLAPAELSRELVERYSCGGEVRRAGGGRRQAISPSSGAAQAAALGQGSDSPLAALAAKRDYIVVGGVSV